MAKAALEIVIRDTGGGAGAQGGGGSGGRGPGSLSSVGSLASIAALKGRAPGPAIGGSAVRQFAGVKSAGSAAGKVVGGIPGLGGLGKGIGSIASAIGPVGVAIAAFAAGGLVVKAFVGALSSAVTSLKEFSPQVAVASAKNEIRQEMAMLRRARAIGPQLARFEETKGKIQDKLFDMGTEILKVLIAIFEVLEPFIDGVLAIPKAVGQIAEDQNTLMNAITEMFSAKGIGEMGQAFGKIETILGKMFGLIEREAEKKEDEEPPQFDPFLEQLLRNFQAGANPGRGVQGLPFAAGGIP